MKIRLAEPLHLVLQGEGKHLGKKMILMRFVGCNIRCRDCDTSYTWNSNIWNKKEFIDLEIHKLLDEIKTISEKYGIFHLLITGGEPALWEKQIDFLIQNLNHYEFDIETSGYFPWSLIKNSEYKDKIYFNVSPKIGSLIPGKDFLNFKIKIFEQPPVNYILKIVISSRNIKKDIEKILEFQRQYNIASEKIYIMPFARNRDELIQECEILLPYCFEFGFEFSPRLHMLMFDSNKLR